jgi:hypothetical protein
MNRRSASAAGLRSAAGIWLPASASPVRGSTICPDVAEKSPARIAPLGTVANWSNSSLPRLPP